MEWPPDFDREENRRNLVRRIFASVEDPRELAKELYSSNPVKFISDCCITYDPRNPGKGLPAKMPFILFDKQIELINWLKSLIYEEEDGLIEKARDMGATWVCACFSVWLWLYVDGSSTGWGSRKEQLVDRLGDPDSIFEKIRMVIRHLPKYTLPEAFSEKDSLTYMKCINHSNGATISGEAGDNIGRGGRKTIYFKDESAHYERAEMIEAALGDNTNVQVDISSVNGEGNVFHRKRLGGIVKVFVMDWRDHPGKTQEWYNKRKKKAESEGLLPEFSREVDRDYAAAVEGILIPSKYAKAILDAHIKLGIEPSGSKIIGLDVADEGGDKNALVSMHGIVVCEIDQWGEGDTDYTAKKAYEYATIFKADRFKYDSIGVGAGVKGSMANISRNGEIGMEVSGFCASDGVVDPEEDYVDDKKNKDMFANLKAQAWWALRDRCIETYKAVTEGKEYDPSKIISIPSSLPLANELISEISRPKKMYDNAGHIMVEPKKSLSKRGIPSPNLAEAFVMCVSPYKPNSVEFESDMMSMDKKSYFGG